MHLTKTSAIALMFSLVLISARAEAATVGPVCDRTAHRVVYTPTHTVDGARIPPARRHREVIRNLVVLKRDRVAWVARERTVDGRPGFGTRYFGCYVAARQHRLTLLGANSSGAATTDRSLRDIALHGRYAAVHISARGDANYDQVRSYDLRTTRARRNSGRISRAPQTPATPALVLVASTNGAIGWLQQGDGALRVTDAHGSRVVASPADGAITHVTLRGATLRWTQGGVGHSSTLR